MKIRIIKKDDLFWVQWTEEELYEECFKSLAAARLRTKKLISELPDGRTWRISRCSSEGERFVATANRRGERK